MSQSQRFRHIDFPVCLYESLRVYYSVNSQGQVSWLYKLEAACIQPMQAPWQSYETQRATNGLIAGSKFQIGDLTNVLNYLYDNVQNRIFITQGYYEQIYDIVFGETPLHYDDVFANPPLIYEREFNDPLPFVEATIHVPATANVSALTATVAQMAINGIQYLIVTF